MIALSEINQQIADIKKDLEGPKEGNETFDKWEKQKKKAAKRLADLNHLRLYLEQNPKPSDLQKHLETLTNKRNLINDPDNFDSWLTSNPSAKNDMKKAKTQYHKEFDLARINSQIKTIQYLLA